MSAPHSKSTALEKSVLVVSPPFGSDDTELLSDTEGIRLFVGQQTHTTTLLAADTNVH